MTSALKVLYYPFSRCIDLSALKQMMMLFETVSFCDPVAEEEWRGHLFRQVGHHDPKFRSARSVMESIAELQRIGVFERIDPSDSRRAQDQITTDAILADLADKEWVELASRPTGMPVQRDMSGAPI